jgi:hypothetical protein
MPASHHYEPLGGVFGQLLALVQHLHSHITAFHDELRQLVGFGAGWQV